MNKLYPISEPYATMLKELCDLLKDNKYGSVLKIYMRQDLIESIFSGRVPSEESMVISIQNYGLLNISLLEPNSNCVYIIEYDTGVKLQRFEPYSPPSINEAEVLNYQINFKNRDRINIQQIEQESDVEVSSEDLSAILSGGI